MRRPIPMPRTRLGTLRRRILVGLAGLLALTLAGCSSAHDSLGTSDGGCFIALPTADTAIHHHGQLLGARLVAVSDLRRRKDQLVYQAAEEARGPRARRVCLVAFVGRFSSATVEQPEGGATGKLAIVVIEYPDSRLLGTVVLSHLPDRFGHPHLG
jgi:hypothetical protein